MATPNIQNQFMYLFERVGEPLYFGPRGASNMYYDIPIDGLPAKLQHAVNEFRKSFTISSGSTFSVPRPQQSPNLTNIGRACPRNALFSYFIPTHRQAAEQLKNILMEQSSVDDFFAMSCTCRDNEMINPRLFIYAFASTCLRRADMRGFRLPAFWEIAPDQFVSPGVIRAAQRQAVMPEDDRSIIMVERNLTGNDSNPENLVSYWREDLGVNSHHWHWHLIYPTTSPRGQRDRKGELFYYMHHDMLARYEAERLCNGLARTRPLDLSEAVTEGYFPKLYNTNAGIIWGARQENTRLQSVDRMADTRAMFQADMEDMKKWRGRIFEAIDTGVVIGEQNKTIQLTVEKGIDVLGDLVEASDLTPNKQFYGDFHNNGHIIIACSHDPKFRHRENIGVMGDSSTAMRDPIFYRWHKYIDLIFDKYKGTVTPYTVQELGWDGITVSDISVQTQSREKNILVTHWMQSDIDLSRGLDFGRTTVNNLGSIWARVTHLDHEEFSYKIIVKNNGQQRNGTVRIFMAPRNNEQRSRFDMAQQRPLFFEMDKFTVPLRPGDNEINRQSTQSSVTIPWEQSFRELERNAATLTASQAVCGCGWPQHMLLPRGSASGVTFDLYVIVTDAAKDQVARKNRQSTEGSRQGCKESISYCGLLDELYPDARAMGFPFDRHARKEGSATVKDLDAFIKGVSNSRTTQVRILHRDITRIRAGGAPTSMDTITSESRPSSTTVSPNTSRPSSPTTQQPQTQRPQTQRPQPQRPTTPTTTQPSRPGRPGTGGGINFGELSGGRPQQPQSGGGGGWWGQPTVQQQRPNGGGNPPWNWPNRGGSGSRSPSPPGWTTISNSSASSSGWGG